MKYLFITRHYLDESSGGSNASKGFIWSLSNVVDDMTLIYPEHDNFDSKAYIPETVKLLPVYDQRSNIQKGLDMYRGRVHRFCDYVKHHLENNRYDVVVIDHSFTAIGVIQNVKKSGAKIITIHHNVETDYLKDNEPSWSYRIPYDYYVKKGERDALELSDLNLTLTDNDAKKFKSWYPDRDLHLHTIGICEYKPSVEKQFEVRTFNNIFVISGSLCFKQSVLPILDFLDRYFPIMLEVCPECKLIITGRNPNNELKQACAKYPNIELVPSPEDIDSVIKRASVYISPIYAGSGIKLRVMDGLRRRMPVLCHEVSAWGYETIVEAGVMNTYHDEDSFRDSLMKVLESGADPNDVYNAYQNYFSLEKGVERFKGVLDDNGIEL